MAVLRVLIGDEKARKGEEQGGQDCPGGGGPSRQTETTATATATIRRLQPLVLHASPRLLQRVYEVVLSDGRTLEVVMPPAPMLRLLRSERRIVDSEAIVVQWLGSLLSEDAPLDSESTREGSEEEESEEEEEEEGVDEGSEGPRSRSSRTRSQQSPSGESSSRERTGLLRLIPKLVRQSSASPELGVPLCIYQPRGGIPIARLPRPLTKQERAEVDYQLGRLTRQFANIKSPTGRFGNAVSVLGLSTLPERRKDGSKPSPIRSASPMTWSMAFHLMFEGVLRDAEDMAISIAYPLIRRHFTRLSYLLDDVTEPSLVFVDGTEDSNVLVTISSTDDEQQDDEDDGVDADGESSVEEEDEASSSTSDGRTRPSRQPPPTIRIVGLRNWSNGIFGDPLLATAFSNNPSQELLSGFHGPGPTGHRYPTPHSEADQDNDNSPNGTRILLYQAYHAVVAIVTEFYRPRSESTTRELAARRKLTEILARLDDVEDEPKGVRHRRPSGEMSPAKKLKSDEEERPPSARPGSSRRQEVMPGDEDDGQVVVDGAV